MILVYGLVTGIFFGIFLQQAQALRFERQVGAMLLKDMTVVKFMLTTIVVASVGIHALQDAGIISFAPRALSLGSQILGGLLFGVGWAIIGYCPGTSIGAIGEGRFHVIWPILGMLLGGIIFALLYPFIQTHIQPLGSFGAISLPQLLGVNHWLVIAALAAGSFFLFRFFERRGL
ncbi:YeeE/YedE family protein [Alkalispirochaeta sphaeroplastigenens]|uniref:YeeE/YedE family protein n=1 Tax=Alkalispirochaeta sphaeroplastigenens TaxID=1187066 RepID=A0A2S4JR49_9SPIO|nr:MULTISPECIES: YeeE/YedE thiosulfate transporter family protein [Alkalispirochaeta]POR01995.1 YeeE/YedE family protein [Alkalispirochaeta sphaeroplastigenens]